MSRLDKHTLAECSHEKAESLHDVYPGINFQNATVTEILASSYSGCPAIGRRYDFIHRRVNSRIALEVLLNFWIKMIAHVIRAVRLK